MSHPTPSTLTIYLTLLCILLCMFSEWSVVEGVTTSQSSTYKTKVKTYAARFAYDANVNTFSCTHLQHHPYLWIDLGKKFIVSSVAITNRVDCCGERLHDLEISIDGRHCAHFKGPGKSGGVYILKCASAVIGRKVKFSIKGKSYLAFADVQVSLDTVPHWKTKVHVPAVSNHETPKDLIKTKNKKTHQSSTYSNPKTVYTSNFAVDGKLNTFSHTKRQHLAYWRVDLGMKHLVTGVVIYIRRDCCGHRFKRVRILVDKQRCSYYRGPARTGHKIVLSCGQPILGRKITIRKEINGFLEMAEVLVSGVKVKQDIKPHEWINANSKKTHQSSTYSTNKKHYTAHLAVDRNVNTFSCTKYQHAPYWSVDLERKYIVTAVVITNRRDCCGKRLHTVAISVDKKTCAHYRGPGGTGKVITIHCGSPVVGRKVMLKIQGKGNLALAEVLIEGKTATGVTKPAVSGNLAHGKKTGQSSTFKYIGASKAVDGDVKTYTHTETEKNPYWWVDLGGKYLIKSIVIYNRRDCCGNRLHNLEITVDGHHCNRFRGPGKNGQKISISCSKKLEGRKVRLQIKGKQYLSLGEVQVFGSKVGKEHEDFDHVVEHLTKEHHDEDLHKEHLHEDHDHEDHDHEDSEKHTPHDGLEHHDDSEKHTHHDDSEKHTPHDGLEHHDDSEHHDHDHDHDSEEDSHHDDSDKHLEDHDSKKHSHHDDSDHDDSDHDDSDHDDSDKDSDDHDSEEHSDDQESDSDSDHHDMVL